MTTAPAISELHSSWGNFDVPAETWRLWRVGPLSVWVQRLEFEWRLAWQTEPQDESDFLPPSANQTVVDEPPDSATFERLAARHLGSNLKVYPRLADRPVVVRPETQFRLAAGGEVDLFIGTPIWLTFETAQPQQLLLDIPLQRPSDTWFGPSTTEGELCYAGRTAARLHRENLPTSSLRAMTRVHLRNRAADELLLERVSLPVPNLALYNGPDRLWTQNVRVDRRSSGRHVEVRIDDAPPPEAEGEDKLSPPRVATGNVFSRALSALLG